MPGVPRLGMAKKGEGKDSPVPKLAKFLSGYSNASTRSGYKSAIESFLRCIYGVKKESSPDYNALFDAYLIDTRRNHDEDFIRFASHLTENHPALSAKQLMQATRYTLNYHGVTISKGTSQDIRRETLKGDAATVDRVLNTKIIGAALQHCDVKARAIFLCLASSGARLDEMLTVRMNDVVLDSNPAKMTFRGSNTKNKKQRYTFISDEAVAAVREWLKVRDEYIEMSNAKSKKLIDRGLATVKTADDPRLFPFSDAAVTKWWNEALEGCGEFTTDDVTNRNQLRIHGFRKFYISQMSLVISKEIPEFLAGHSGYLTGAYRRYDEETVAAEYLKAMHMVSITGTKQIKELENELKKTITEQSVKTEKHADALAEMFMENSNLRKSVTALQEENARLNKTVEGLQSTVERVDALQKAMVEFISSDAVLSSMENMSDDGGARLHEKLEKLLG